MNPRYPIYIVSKGRADSRLTVKSLERMNVPYYIAIEPQDFDDYSKVLDEKNILVLPFSNHGLGPGVARNWCWEHSIQLGFKRHWVLDDNIIQFLRLDNNRRIESYTGTIFAAAEDFVDRFTNVPISGFAYKHFTVPNIKLPPFVINTRIYSCLLIENGCNYRWRGKYNEDTDLSLRVLKDGLCTIQFNAFLQDKIVTQALKGGNTEEFYAKEGTYNKSKMLYDLHPDVTKLVKKYGRWHHYVNYLPFKKNKLIYRDDIDLDELSKMKVNNYGMILTEKVKPIPS